MVLKKMLRKYRMDITVACNVGRKGEIESILRD